MGGLFLFFLFTFFLVHAQDDDDLVPADSDQLLDRSDTTTGEFREQDHSFDVVVLELMSLFIFSLAHCSRRIRAAKLGVTKEGTHQFDIGTHLGNLPDLHHDELIDLWIACLVVTHCGRGG